MSASSASDSEREADDEELREGRCERFHRASVRQGASHEASRGTEKASCGRHKMRHRRAESMRDAGEAPKNRHAEPATARRGWSCKTCSARQSAGTGQEPSTFKN